MKEIIIQNKITQRDYLYFLFSYVYRKSNLKYLYIYSFYWIIMALLDILGIFKNSTESPNFLLICFLLFILYYPIKFWIKSKREFKSNKIIEETMTFHFSDEEIQIEGESFKNHFTWEKLYEITEFKNCVLLHRSDNVGIIILKKSFKEQFTEFRIMVKSHTSLYSKFRKNTH